MTEPGKPDTPQHRTWEISSLPDHAHVDLQPDAIILDRYKVIGILGVGGMGSVFHVKHLHLQSEFALKVLNKQADKTLWRRFENEARAASRLDHPNLIKVYDSGLLPDGQPFFVMEYVKGQTLSDLMAKHGRLPLRKTLKIFIQVGFALAYAHDNGVIHRDLKPSNIMLTRGLDGSLTSAVKVVDLGIAKLTGIDEYNQQTLTRTGEIFGSPLYMSPEQCMGTTVESRADLYSLGCSMYEALTGAPPFIGENALSTMMKHQLNAPLSLKEASLGIEFPKQVEQLVAKLLEKNPLSRYPNAQLLTADLVRIEQELGESENNNVVVAKSAAAENSDGFGFFAFINRHGITILLMILCYLLGLATNVFRHSEHQPHAAVPKPDPLFAIFPDGQVKRREVTPVERQKHTYFSTLSSDGKSRLFRFPNQSIGTIIVNRGNEQRARGNILVPASATITFRPDARFLDSPLLLERFRPEELVGLHLCDFARTSIDIFKILPNFPRIDNLQIVMDVDDSIIPYINQLPRLCYLDVSNTALTGEGLSRLNRLPSIANLDCSNIEGITPVLRKLSPTNLKILKVQSTKLKPADLKIIGRLKSLEVLDMGGNQGIDDNAFRALENLHELSQLRVDTCSITGKSLNVLAGFKKLQGMVVSKSGWTAKQMDELVKSTQAGVDFRGQPTNNVTIEENILPTKTGK